ncbi:MAG: Gfo/Idh/MocA family oxidoreductase [Betaproteobacteria bacterium]|jgi:predicted dehydrogenase
MIRLAVVGLGKMGLSHLGMIRAHPNVSVEGICDSTGYLLDVLEKYTGLRTFSDFDRMLAEVELDAVIIATPSRTHGPMVRKALERGLHVFCEKPFCLDTRDGDAAVQAAKQRNLVNQVGYHYRFVGAFQEVKRLLDGNAIGNVTHILAEAYGPVVLRPKGFTWRTQRQEGGGCLYDYAAHPINLVNWYLGMPTAVAGTALHGVFSQDTDDEVFSTLYFNDGVTAQLSVNWSDESYRKMSTKITLWGTGGKIYADRQECQVYLRDTVTPPAGYKTGWNVRYTTDLTAPVWFYIRGEEYSAQLDYFVTCVENRVYDNVNSFDRALETDTVISMILADAERSPSGGTPDSGSPSKKKRFLFV